MDYQNVQAENFAEVLDILQQKGITPAIQECIDVFDDIFSSYTIMDLSWDFLLCKIRELDGAELETFLLQVAQTLAEIEE